MLYSEARPLIASGDLLAFANHGPVSELIRHWCGGSWSHVGIAWRYRDRVFVLAAREGRGVGLDALSTQLACAWISTGAAWTEDVEAVALDRLGLPYSYSDCARIALGLSTVHPDEVCSVYAATVLKAGRLSLPLRSYTPSALVDAVLASGGEMRVVSPVVSQSGNRGA